MPADTGSFHLTGYAPSVILDGVDPLTGDMNIRVQDPEITSESRHTSKGHVSARAKGVVNVGRKGEPRLIKVLRKVFQLSDQNASIAAGEDVRGEDAVITHGGATFILQAVTAPADPRFWKEVKGGAEATTDVGGAVAWLRDVIVSKAARTPPTGRSRTVLAIDARHIGVISRDVVVQAYVAKYHGPAEEFGFAAVWVVGPTERHCRRVGEGTP